MDKRFIEVSNIETNMCFIKLAEAMIFVNDVKSRIKAFGKIFDRDIEKKFRHLLFLMQDAVDYHEKCGDCEENKQRIFDFIKSLPDGMDMITESDIDRLKLR